MTRSRIYASGTYEDPVILSDTKDTPKVLQELTPKREATVINQPPTPSRILLALIVAGLLKIL